MRSALAKLKLAHLVLAALLAATFWFPSAREAHSLCFRLLLHLKGDTVVHGQQPGCIIQTIPQVDFTPQGEAEIRKCSKDSLDGYALAICTGDESTLEAPTIAAVSTNHPLLAWAALRMSMASDWQRDTNKPATFKLLPATVASARQAITLAQSVEPTNGALWLAEACLNFSEHHDAAALAALQQAASNSSWSAHSAVAFTNLVALCRSAGLSELDAAVQANWGRADASPLELQGYASRNLTRLFTQAVSAGDEAMLSKLLKICTDLRRAEWSDKSTAIFNSISLRDYYDDLINAMTLKLGRNPIPTNDAVDYRELNKLKQQNFNDYFNQLSDQRLATIYLTQNEKVHYEKRLRSQINDHFYPQTFYWSAFADISAGLATSAISMAVFLALLELLIWKLDLQHRDFKSLLRQPKFQLGAFAVSLGLALLMTNWSICLGMNAKVGFGLADETPPLLPPDLRDFLFWLFIPLAILFAMYLTPAKFFKVIDWQLKPGWLTMSAIGVYLISILVMAFCRHWLVDLISSQYL